MYKTVRQGENSLQYTILPQTEEVFTNSGLKGKGRDYSPSSHARRINRKVVVYYLAAVVFGLLLTVGTLLFVLVLSGIVPVDLPSRISVLKLEGSGPTSTPHPTDVSRAVLGSAATVSSVDSPTTEWMFPARKRLHSAPSPAPSAAVVPRPTENPTSGYVRKSNADRMMDRDRNETGADDDDDDNDDDEDDYAIEKKDRTTTEPAPSRSTGKPIADATTAVYASVDNSKTPKGEHRFRSDKLSDIKDTVLGDEDEEYKEPPGDEDDAVKMSQTKSSWLQTRWPFVDPSSYFQWTGYSARDNLLLPAILSAALSALLVVAILCYTLRRRQRCKRRIQEIGNLTSDLQEDNAILLTAENPSEED